MNDIQTADTIAAAFITRWELSGGKELANYQSFLIEGAEKEILFVNDTTLYLQAGTLKRLLEILNTASTQVLNAYYGSTFPDSTLSRRETQLTEELMKTCDQIIYGNGA